jgi:outer membrane receptor for ferrienterochelin and colicin
LKIKQPKYLVISLILLLVLACNLSAQEPATISGHITEQETGDPLVGVNVIIKGTYYGTASDDNGYYRIDNISPGVYNLRFTMMGYKTKLFTGIKLEAGEDRQLDVDMPRTTLAAGQEIVVVGKREVVDVENTSSLTEYSSEEIDDKIAESVTDIIKDQVGVVSSNNQIHVRGGRVDESQFIVDGLSLKDPLSGSVSRLYVSPNAVEQLKFISGGFNAEYGQAMSGIIDIELKEGSSQWEGSLKYKRDEIPGADGFNTDIAEFTLGGPEPITGRLLEGIGLDIPGELYFFSSGYMNISDTYLPHADQLYPKEAWMENFAPRGNNRWSWMNKLTWKFDDRHRLIFSQNNSLNINQGFFSYRGFRDEYIHNLDNYLTVTKGTYVTNIIWRHTLSPKAFYNVKLGRFLTFEHADVQNKHWTEYNETLDLRPVEYTQINEEGDIRIKQGDEYWDSGDDPHWYDYSSNNFNIDADFTYQPGSMHRIKAGLETRFTNMQLIDIYKPWMGGTGLGQSWDKYKVHPINGSFYAQDKITFEGMIVNAGLRYDYWFPGQYVEDAVNNQDVFTITEQGRKKFKNETFKLFGARGKGHLSPRLGISHPVTDQDVLYFNYGHFSQLPTYKFVYAKLTSNSNSTYSLIGNPNLDPKVTVAYELGIKHKLARQQAIEFKAFYKDMFNYETAASITTFNPKLGRYSFMMYINSDYARSRGVELIYRNRSGEYITGNLNASYSIVTGKSSRPDASLLVQAGRLDSKPLGESYLAWDRPIQVSGNLRVHVFKDTQPRLFGLPMPNNWGVNLHLEVQSGERYTSSTITDTIYQDGNMYLTGPSNSDKPYEKISDMYSLVDIKIYKSIYRTKNFSSRIFLQIENLLNKRVARYINPYTGEPFNPGNPISYSYIDRPNPNYDPSRFERPRQIMLGVSCRF